MIKPFHLSRTLRRLLLSLFIVAAICVAGTVQAVDFNGVYSESFNSMGTTGTTPPTGWSVKIGNSGTSNATWTTSIPGSGATALLP